jgi:hypothetical protein
MPLAVRHRPAAPLIVALVAALAFWRTAYPTVTWWDSSSYSLAAVTLGLTSSPGSLLLTLLGWAATRLVPAASAAHALNLLAGALAACTAASAYAVARRLLGLVDETGRAATVSAAAGALALAFGSTLWEYAVMFTPYVLTALFTGLLLLVMVRWWEAADDPRAWRWLALLAFLFGLDFSVHRSNALLMPAAAVWILMRRPDVLRRPATWLGGAGGMLLGLAVQLLVIPIARHTHSPLNMAEPTTWARFWDYVSLSQVGGGFLLDVWPRKAPFWSVQVADFARVLRDNYLRGVLPALAAAFGVVTLSRRDRRLGAAFVAVLVVQAFMTVFYFNIPASYFRSLDRHYLPVLVTVGVAAACGAGAAARRWRAGAVAVAAVPAVQLLGNWASHDASRRWFAHDYAANALRTLPPRALYFTVGDNDTFPLWYLQYGEGVRPDVRVVNLSLANAGWYVRQLTRRDPSFPVSTVPSDDRGKPGRQPAADTLVVLADGVTVRPRPLYGTDWLVADGVLLDIVRTNAWRDPVCFSGTGGPEVLGWLAAHARPEGLHACVTKVPNAPVDRGLLRANLLERAVYRGYADPRVAIDETARNLGALSVDALGTLLGADRAAGDVARCRDDARRLFRVLPPERVGYTAPQRAELEARCG